jgi:two-component system LytT family response regulator
MLLARKRIQRVLRQDAEIEIIGECADGREAVEAVTELKPDLMFLDVQMPEVGGFEALEEIGTRNAPVVIFVTAYDQFALKAFEVHALDYLLHPFDADRLKKTLERAKQQIRQQETEKNDDRLLALLKTVKENPKYLKRMTVKSRGRTIFLNVEEIDYITAEGNYLSLQVGQEAHLIRSPLHQFEEKLDPEKFVRIHRSAIINLDRVREMHPLFNGDQLVIMKNGKELTLSRNYRDRLRELLESF